MAARTDFAQGDPGSPAGNLGNPLLAGETGRTSPYQVESTFRPPVEQSFKALLPVRPYCSDDLGFGLRIRPRIQALKSSYIQLNAPSNFCFLPFDIDRAHAAFAWEESNLPAPNIIIANPGNGHAHLVYMLADPVHALAQSRARPLRYLADIERGMIRRLEADPRYSGFIAKNPVACRWRTRWLAPFPYHLAQLDAHLTLRSPPQPKALQPPCGAKTRTGTPCRRRSFANGRCLNHGGLSSGPKSSEGRQRIAAAQRRRWERWRSQQAPLRTEEDQ